MNRGICHYILGNSDKAVEDMGKVIAIDPKWVNAYKVRGAAYTKLGKLDLAAADQKKVAELEPVK